MSDKAMFIILMICASIGLMSYDQHMIETQGVSPIGSMIDFAGFAKLKSAPDGLSSTSSMATFQESAEHNLARLRQLHQSMYQERINLITKHKKIITRLSNMNSQVLIEAEKYTELLDLHSNAIHEKFPLLKDLKTFLEKSVSGEVTDSERVLSNTQKSLQQLSDELTITEGSSASVKKLAKDISTLASIDHPTMRRRCLNREMISCLQEEVEEIENRFVMHINPDEASVVGDLVALINLSNFLKTDLDLQNKNLELSDVIVDESDAYIEGEFRSLIQQMVHINKDDLSDLITLYQQLHLDHKNLMKNVQYIQENLVSSFDALDIRGEQLNEKLKTIAGLEVLTEFFDSTKNQREHLHGDIQEAGKSMSQFVKHRTFENQRFLSELGNLVSVDLKKMVENREYALQQNQRYLPNRMAMRRAELERGGRPHRPEIESQPIRQHDRAQPPQADIRQNQQTLRRQADLQNLNVSQNFSGPSPADIRDKQRQVRQMLRDSRSRAQEQGFFNR